MIRLSTIHDIQVYKLDITSRVLKLKMPPIKSAVWSYFQRSSDGKTVKCTLCEMELTFCGGTTNMHNHIRLKHPSDEKPTAQSTLSGFVSSPRKMNAGTAEKVTVAITNMIVQDYLPVSLVEGDGFRNLMNILAPDYKVPSRNTIRSRICRIYEEQKIKLLSELSSVSSDPRYKRLTFASVEQCKMAEDCLESKLNDLPLNKLASDEILSPPTKRQRRPSGIDFLLSESPEKNSCLDEHELKNYMLDKTDYEPLKWWSENEKKYPKLAIIAKRVLSVPATSVPSERIFSSAGLIVTKLRNRLSPEIVDQIIFLNKNKLDVSHSDPHSSNIC